jgi:hypothetical protein
MGAPASVVTSLDADGFAAARPKPRPRSELRRLFRSEAGCARTDERKKGARAPTRD